MELWIISKLLCFLVCVEFPGGCKWGWPWSWNLFAENSSWFYISFPLDFPQNFSWLHVEASQLNASKCQAKMKVEGKKKKSEKPEKEDSRVVAI